MVIFPNMLKVTAAPFFDEDGKIDPYKMDYGYLEGFLTADSEKDFKCLAEREGFIFANGTKATVRTMKVLQEFLELALALKKVLESKTIESTSLDDLGITLKVADEYDVLVDSDVSIGREKREIEEHLVSNPEDAEFLKSYCMQLDSMVIAEFYKNIPCPQYADFLRSGIAKGYNLDRNCCVNSDNVLTIKHDYRAIGFVQERKGSSSEKLAAELSLMAVSDVLDSLFSVHLTDVVTQTVNGGEDARVCVSPISSIWMTLVESISLGRSGRCATCGKSFIALNERGSKRRFCSQKCSKKNQRLEKFVRLTNDGVPDDEAAKESGVHIKDALQYRISKPTPPNKVLE